MCASVLGSAHSRGLLRMAGLHAYVERAESRPEITAGWA